jgi:hypothetical protein
MAQSPEMRASDADRDRVARALREHCAQGRIAVDELGERLERVYGARTLGELEAVTGDLPETDLYELPVPASRESLPARRMYWMGLRAGWATYAAVNAVCLVIWLITAVTTGAWYPWWLWVAGPWGAVMVAGQVLGPRRR